MSLHPVSLDDKYTFAHGRVFISGTQALVRLPMIQHMRDRALGLNSAGYITGYRGSPLGTFDEQLNKAAKPLAAHNVVFVPGVNEDLAATAVWGSQQAEASGEGKTTACSPCGTARGPALTVRVTPSGTGTWRAHRSMAASWS